MIGEGKYNADFKRLEKNIVDSVIEEQIKLGYEKETLRLYYPEASLKNILDLNADSDKLKSMLSEFAEKEKDILGEVNISEKKGRFCIAVSPFGCQYVHDNFTVNEFWKDFINIMRKHDINIEQIKNVFRKYSPDFNVDIFEGEDFDYALSFKDVNIDEYVYCIKFEEGGHAVYHRFIREDYEELFSV